ncbi:Fic/DOC family N-terminal domain-containing protein [Clostridium tagluense]|uniref:Fic/DOC family N-terminal domain-containing protein n=1 Tax=Clostridium tagluense TaxID=360422 RepID=UPI001C6E0C94|nr:hypothetical protein [Clostridium tagluense]MBW9159735.1 hypothetical protein [Clostridium tagluense]WLC66167.1 hypothetical protein KTC93_02735 [Clostridium tagluense]
MECGKQIIFIKMGDEVFTCKSQLPIEVQKMYDKSPMLPPNANLETKDSSAIKNIITTHDDLYKAMSGNSMINSATKEVF